MLKKFHQIKTLQKNRAKCGQRIVPSFKPFIKMDAIKINTGPKFVKITLYIE